MSESKTEKRATVGGEQGGKVSNKSQRTKVKREQLKERNNRQK